MATIATSDFLLLTWPHWLKEPMTFCLQLSFSIADLKGICVNELPSHLVPSRFHKIATIPITGNGKVDKEKLRAMANSRGGWFNISQR